MAAWRLVLLSVRRDSPFRPEESAISPSRGCAAGAILVVLYVAFRIGILR